MILFKNKKALSTLLILSITISLAFAAGDITCEITTAKDGTETSNCPNLHTCINNICVHKELFPLAGIEYLGTFFLMFLAGLANAGGLGGGALLTPILLIFFNYDPNKAIMIVYSIVFGGSLGNFLNVALKKNPETGKSFVDFDLSLICMPLMVAGANVGVLLNHIFPPIIVLVGLIGTMIYTGKKVYAKAQKTYAQESNQKKQQPFLDKNSPEPPRRTTKENVELSVLDSSRGPSSTDHHTATTSEELQVILKEDKELFPTQKLKIIAAMLAFTVLVMIVKGSKSADSLIGVGYCGAGYWIIFILGMIGCYGFWRFGVQEVEKRLEIKRRHNYNAEGEGFSITPEIINKITLLSIVTGIAAGLLGIGGGMVMSPSLLSYGMAPQALAATAGFFVVQTSFVTLFQSFYAGDVSGTETVFFMTVAFVGSMGVSMSLNYLIQKYKRPSILLFALSFVVFLSLVIMPAFAIYKSIQNPSQMFVAGSLC